MSMDDPNEYERAIEDYAECVRRDRAAELAHIEALRERELSRTALQAQWRQVLEYVREGKILPGVYRINKGPGHYAEALLIDASKDYPDLMPMFR